MRFMPLVLPLMIVACASPSMLPEGTRIGEPIQDREIQTLAAVQSAPAEHYERTLFCRTNKRPPRINFIRLLEFPHAQAIGAAVAFGR